MNSNPFAHLSEEEQRILIERSKSGEHPVFEGEEATVPLIDTGRYAVHTGRFFEVEPDQLLDVAKHIAATNEPAQKTVERAYSLICEAHLVSRNIKHWNEKARRGHFEERIHRVVAQNVIQEGADAGKVVRLDLLVAFLKERNGTCNQRDAQKRFNRWVSESLRLRSFCAEIPWDPHAPGFDEKLSRMLREKGWIREFRVGSARYLILPEQTDPPRNKSRRKRRKGDRVTRPWWETKTVWWPGPSPQEIKEFKAEYLVDRQKHFRGQYTACMTLKKFEKWLDIEEQIATRNRATKSKQTHDAETGKFR